MVLANIIATSIGCHICGGLFDGVILIPVEVTGCGNGVTSFQRILYQTSYRTPIETGGNQTVSNLIASLC